MRVKLASALLISFVMLTGKLYAEKVVGPLDRPDAYSLYINEQGWDYANHFPLGILGPRDRNELIHYGFDFTEAAQEGHYFINNGVGIPPPSNDKTLLGLYANAWSHHTMYHIKEIKGYGHTPSALQYDGTPQPIYHVSIYSPVVRKFILDADAALAKSWGQQTRPVLMWGLDNELEGYLDYSPEAKAEFIEWLRKTYSSVQELNEAWGSSYGDYSEADPPDAEPKVTRPAAWLDWHAFLEYSWTAFTAERYKAIYENDPLHRTVASKATQCNFDMPTLVKQRTLDPGLHGELTRQYGGWIGVDMYGADDRLAYEANYAHQCIRPSDINGIGRVLLPETNNHSGPGWQWANTMWRMLGNGVKGFDFFCFGSVGATGDWDTYGMTATDGSLKSKMVYAARFANSVRRIEAFWARSKPAVDVPKAAILLPRRDVLLEDNPVGSLWDTGANDRYQVHCNLRDCGIWTDIIPYTKLNTEFLKQYNMLFLVGARHLTLDECSEIRKYVQNGGVLIGDAMSGHYDEHHRAINGLEDIFGVEVSNFETFTDLWINTKKGILRGDSLAVFQPKTAEIIELTTREQRLVSLNHFGKGKALYLATPLGMLHSETPGNNLVAAWMDELFNTLQIKTSYRTSKGAMPDSLRVETPYLDDKGNMACIVANRIESIHPKAALDITLPTGSWSKVYWAPAENMEIKEIGLRKMSDSYRVSLPAFKTSGMLLFINENRPLISVSSHNTSKTGVDGYLPVLEPLKEHKIKVSLINPSGTNISAGILKIRALPNWKLSVDEIKTPMLKPGEKYDMNIKITAPDSGVLHYRERMYPINIRWSNEFEDRSVCSALVGVNVDEKKLPKLLSDNTGYPDVSPRKIKTGATYKYLFDEIENANKFGDICTAVGRNGNALQNGSGGWDNFAIFHQGLPPKLPIEFDLKDAYPLETVKLQMAMPAYPNSMEVEISTDGTRFKSIGTAEVDGPAANAKWIELTNLNRQKARYVRLYVDLPNGGYLDEVEIWGYEK